MLVGLAREVPELCFVADPVHGLALFPGAEAEAEEVVARIRRRCGKAEVLKVLKLGIDVDESEANHMLVTCRIPRRVAMRLAK